MSNSPKLAFSIQRHRLLPNCSLKDGAQPEASSCSAACAKGAPNAVEAASVVRALHATGTVRQLLAIWGVSA